MKIRIFVILLPVVFSVGFAHEKEVDYDAIVEGITSYHKKVKKGLPQNLEKQLLECEDLDDIGKIDRASQLEFDKMFNGLHLKNVANELDKIKYFTGDDVGSLYKLTFIQFINKKPIEVEEMILDTIEYWKESEGPKQRVSPLGRNEINWGWSFGTDVREFGVIHIGYDTKTNEILCYERDVGIYYASTQDFKRIDKQLKDSDRYNRIRSVKNAEATKVK